MEQWEFVEPFLPPKAKEGRPRADDRQTVNAILYVLKTGIPWNDDLPDGYGDEVTAWRRLRGIGRS
jgi:transposase